MRGAVWCSEVAFRPKMKGDGGVRKGGVKEDLSAVLASAAFICLTDACACFQHI